MQSDFRSSRILIAGLGLIGGSIAKALAADGYREVYAFDRDAQTLADAKSDGVIREGYTALTGDIPAFGLVVCCLSPAHVVPLYEDAAPYIKEGGVFAEVGGIKQVMIDTLQGAMRDTHELLSLHPMAGSELIGYAHSNRNMFAGSVLIAVLGIKTGDIAVAWADLLTAAMQCERIQTLSAQAHDRIIAHVSHIPHVAALAIKAMYPGSGDERFAGGSYKAITRVADINAALWAGLMTDNSGCLLEALEELKKQISRIETAIEAGDAAALQTLLENISES